MAQALVILSSPFAALSMLVLGNVLLRFIFPKQAFGIGIEFFAGLGIFGLYSNVLLISGVFDWQLVFLPVVLGWAACIWRERNAITNFSANSFMVAGRTYLSEIVRRANFPLLCCVVIATAIWIVLNFVPLNAIDALGYHLPFVQSFISTHRLSDPIAGLTHDGYGYFPALAEITYAGFVLLTGAATFTIPLITLYGAMLVMLQFALFRTMESFIPRSSVRLLVLLLPFVMPVWRDAILAVGTVDVIVASYMVLGLLLALRGLHEHERSYLYLGAFFLALGAAIKYTALLAVGYCGLVALAMLLFDKPTRKLFGALCISVLLFFLASGYWYVKNLLLHGSPVYPLGSGIGPENEILANDFLPHALWVRVLYPVIVYARFFFTSVYARLAVFEFLAAAVAVGGSLVALARKQYDFWLLTLLGFALLNSWALSFITDDARYNIPSLLVLCILCGLLVNKFLGASQRVEIYFSRAAAVCFIVLLPFMVAVYKDRIYFELGKTPTQQFIAAEDSNISAEVYTSTLRVYQ